MDEFGFFSADKTASKVYLIQVLQNFVTHTHVEAAAEMMFKDISKFQLYRIFFQI